VKTAGPSAAVQDAGQMSIGYVPKAGWVPETAGPRRVHGRAASRIADPQNDYNDEGGSVRLYHQDNRWLNPVTLTTYGAFDTINRT
jgi:hypothetical protein